MRALSIVAWASLSVAMPADAAPPSLFAKMTRGVRALGQRLQPSAPKRSAIHRYAPARDALKQMVLRLEQEPTAPATGRASPEQALVTTSRQQELRQAITALETGRTIGQSIRGIDRVIQVKTRQLREIDRSKPRIWQRLWRRSPREIASKEEKARTRQQLRSEIDGMKLAVNDLLENAHGLRGSAIAFETGISASFFSLASLNARLGIQLNGSDTGRFPVRPYLRLGGGLNLGPVGSRGNVVMGGINGTYGSGAVGLGARLELSPYDPVTPNKLSLSLLSLRLSVAGRRTLGGELSLPLPISPVFTVMVENTKLNGARDRLLNRGAIARQRQKFPLLDRILSETPPSPSEILSEIRSARAAKQQLKQSLPAAALP